MKYKRADNGAKVKEQGDPITKESVFKMTQARINKEFPNNKFSEDDVRTVSMVWLLSGLRPEVMDKQLEKLREKAAPKVVRPKSARGGEADPPEEPGEGLTAFASKG